MKWPGALDLLVTVINEPLNGRQRPRKHDLAWDLSSRPGAISTSSRSCPFRGCRRRPGRCAFRRSREWRPLSRQIRLDPIPDSRAPQRFARPVTEIVKNALSQGTQRAGGGSGDHQQRTVKTFRGHLLFEFGSFQKLIEYVGLARSRSTRRGPCASAPSMPPSTRSIRPSKYCFASLNLPVDTPIARISCSFALFASFFGSLVRSRLNLVIRSELGEQSLVRVPQRIADHAISCLLIHRHFMLFLSIWISRPIVVIILVDGVPFAFGLELSRVFRYSGRDTTSAFDLSVSADVTPLGANGTSSPATGVTPPASASGELSFRETCGPVRVQPRLPSLQPNASPVPSSRRRVVLVPPPDGRRRGTLRQSLWNPNHLRLSPSSWLAFSGAHRASSGRPSRPTAASGLDRNLRNLKS